MRRSSVLGDRFAGLGVTSKPESSQMTVFFPRFLTAAGAGEVLTAAFAGPAAGCFFVVAFVATDFFGAAFFGAVFVATALLVATAFFGRTFFGGAFFGGTFFATFFGADAFGGVAFAPREAFAVLVAFGVAFFAAFLGEAAFDRADALRVVPPRGALVVALAARRAPLLPAAGIDGPFESESRARDRPGERRRIQPDRDHFNVWLARRTWAAFRA